MILQLLGIVTIVVFTIFVFRTAIENGRNGAGWGAACLFAGLFLQWVLPILVVIAVALLMILGGTRPENVENELGWWSFGITFGGLALSLVGMFLILRKVVQLPDDEEPFIEPPSPPTFDSNGQ